MIAVRAFYREIAQTIAMVLLLFILLMVSLDALDQMRFLGRAGYTWKTLIAVVLLNAPDYIYRLLPICTLIGSVLALSNMAARSELIAWRASGMSVARMVAVVAGLGAILAVAVFLLGEAGIAAAEAKSKSIKNAALRTDNYFKQPDGFWNKQVIEPANSHSATRFINVRTVRNGDTLRDVRLYEFDAAHQLRGMTFAHSAKELRSGVWQLTQVTQLRFEYNDKGVISQQSEFSLPQLELDLGANTLATISNRGQSYIGLPLTQLYARMQTLKESGQRSREFEVGFWLKLFYPLGIVVMLLLALPFAFMNTRKGGVGSRVVMGIMLGLGYFILTAMAQFLGPLLPLFPPLVAILPSALFLLIAGLWLRRVTRVS